MVKKAFSGGALILTDMDGHDFNMPTNSDAVILYFTWRGLVGHLIFMSKKKKNIKNVKRQIKNLKQREKIKKVDWKPKRAIYVKGKQKKEHEKAC